MGILLLFKLHLWKHHIKFNIQAFLNALKGKKEKKQLYIVLYFTNVHIIVFYFHCHCEY